MFGNKNKTDSYVLLVDDLEKRIIIQALSDLKDKQKLENKNYDFLDNLIVRTCDAPMASSKHKFYYEQTR